MYITIYHFKRDHSSTTILKSSSSCVTMHGKGYSTVIEIDFEVRHHQFGKNNFIETFRKYDIQSFKTLKQLINKKD